MLDCVITILYMMRYDDQVCGEEYERLNLRDCCLHPILSLAFVRPSVVMILIVH